MSIFLRLILALEVGILLINANPIEEQSVDNFYSILNPVESKGNAYEFSNEQSSNEDDDLLPAFYNLDKKSAPRRIFIGKRSMSSPYGNNLDEEDSNELLESYSMDKKNPRRHLFLGKRSFKKANGKRHIQRIFIGKRGEIKRIFIG